MGLKGVYYEPKMLKLTTSKSFGKFVEKVPIVKKKNLHRFLKYLDQNNLSFNFIFLQTI